MPPRIALRTQVLRETVAEGYVCPRCVVALSRDARPSTVLAVKHLSTAPLYRVHGGRRPQSERGRRTSCRYASSGTLASQTAINAPSTVPPAYRDLHQRLLALQDQAGTYVNLSRLQLAARSLESGRPVLRVALLGLGRNGAQAARKLARVLLSDPLSDEEEWEREILQSGQDGRSLLLRYGDSEDLVQHNPLLETLHVPSPYLRRHNVELLVSTMNAGGTSAGVSEAELEEAILVPPLTTPTSAGGRMGFVRYPVHKALVVAEGVTGAVEYGRLPRFLDRTELINAALSLPLHPSSNTPAAEEVATDNVVDIDLASHALTLFRTNKANGAQFSEEWQTSRLPALSQWLAGPKEAPQDGLQPAVQTLLNSILLNTAATISRAENAQKTEATNATVTESVRRQLDDSISTWSADWHRDLQTNLAVSLQSKIWRRTAWWRLLWRIDDVSVSAADVLRLGWLTEAEQSLAFVSGKIGQAGLATENELREAGADNDHAVKDAEGVTLTLSNWEPKKAQVISAPKQMQAAELFQMPSLLARVKDGTGVNAAFDPPWPRTIHLARQQMLHTIVPEMHRKAQALLLQTLSTACASSALGAWIYVATAGSAIEGAGAIAALGIVWSLRRLQKIWSKEREGFAISLKENGRRVLAGVETHLRRLVREGGRVTAPAEEVQSWQRARAAVQECREKLEELRRGTVS